MKWTFLGPCLMPELVLWPIGQEPTRLWEKVTLGLTKIKATYNSVYRLSASLGLVPSQSTAPVPCWCGKCRHLVMETQTVPEYPHQLSSLDAGITWHTTGHKLPPMNGLGTVLISLTCYPEWILPDLDQTIVTPLSGKRSKLLPGVILRSVLVALAAMIATAREG